jgi:hypothetical protein
MSTALRFALITVTLAAPIAFASNNADWENVTSLKPGEKVGVIQTNQKRVEGRFQFATESGITIRADREITVPKTEVVRVYRHGGHSRTTKALIGAAIGVAAGGILYGTVGDRFRNEGQDVSAGLWIGGGAGIGAGIGALLGGHDQTLYRRPFKP